MPVGAHLCVRPDDRRPCTTGRTHRSAPTANFAAGALAARRVVAPYRSPINLLALGRGGPWASRWREGLRRARGPPLGLCPPGHQASPPVGAAALGGPRETDRLHNQGRSPHPPPSGAPSPKGEGLRGFAEIPVGAHLCVRPDYQMPAQPGRTHRSAPTALKCRNASVEGGSIRGARRPRRARGPLLARARRGIRRPRL